MLALPRWLSWLSIAEGVVLLSPVGVVAFLALPIWLVASGVTLALGARSQPRSASLSIPVMGSLKEELWQLDHPHGTHQEMQCVRSSWSWWGWRLYWGSGAGRPRAALRPVRAPITGAAPGVEAVPDKRPFVVCDLPHLRRGAHPPGDAPDADDHDDLPDWSPDGTNVIFMRIPHDSRHRRFVTS